MSEELRGFVRQVSGREMSDKNPQAKARRASAEAVAVKREAALAEEVDKLAALEAERETKRKASGEKVSKTRAKLDADDAAIAKCKERIAKLESSIAYINSEIARIEAEATARFFGAQDADLSSGAAAAQEDADATDAAEAAAERQRRYDEANSFRTENPEEDGATEPSPEPAPSPVEEELTLEEKRAIVEEMDNAYRELDKKIRESTGVGKAEKNAKEAGIDPNARPPVAPPTMEDVVSWLSTPVSAPLPGKQKDGKEGGESRRVIPVSTAVATKTKMTEDGKHVVIYDPETGTAFQVEKGLYDLVNDMDATHGGFADTVVGKALAETVEGSDFGTSVVKKMGAFLDFIGATLRVQAKVFRAGATGLNVVFNLATNPFRDFETVLYNTRTGLFPGAVFKNWIATQFILGAHALTGGRAFAQTDVVKFKELYENLGMGFSTSLMQDTNNLDITVLELTKDGTVLQKTTRKIKSIWEFFMNVLQFPEVGARVAEMKTLAEQRGWDINSELDNDQLHQLATAGKEVTVDFSRSGKMARVWNRYLPFFNASIQGKKSAWDSMKRNPVGWLLTRGLTNSLLAVAIWWRNKDEDWWKEMPLGEKYSYDFIRVGKEVLRLPRSFEVDTLFRGGTIAMLEAWYEHDASAVREWFKGSFEENSIVGSLDTGINFDVLPPIVREGVSQVHNWDYFWKNKIVPTAQADEEAAKQYGAYTTVAAIRIGEITGMSPRRIDHFVRGMAAGLGGNAMALFGRGGELHPWRKREIEPSDTPIVGTAFLRRGGTEIQQSRTIERLYAKLAEVTDRNAASAKKGALKEIEKKEQSALKNAVQAVNLVALAQYEMPEREPRRALSALKVSIAQEALEIHSKGQFYTLEQRSRQLKREHYMSRPRQTPPKTPIDKNRPQTDTSKE
jgi:hypothetical protein